MRMSTMHRAHVASALLAALCALPGCADDRGGESVGGHTNWLPCTALADCSGHARAVACSGGYCVDAAGARVRVPSNGSSDAAVTPTRDGAANRPPADGGADGGGAGEDGTAGSAGVGAPDAAAGPACRPSICEAGQTCCDVCTGLCIPAASGAACPNSAPDTDCGDGGTGDGGPSPQQARIPECPGPTERCASERCVAGQACVGLSCRPGLPRARDVRAVRPMAAPRNAWPTRARASRSTARARTGCAPRPIRSACSPAAANVYTQGNFRLGPAMRRSCRAAAAASALPRTRRSPRLTATCRSRAAPRRPGLQPARGPARCGAAARGRAHTRVRPSRRALVLDRRRRCSRSARPIRSRSGRLLGTLRPGDDLDGHVVSQRRDGGLRAPLHARHPAPLPTPVRTWPAASGSARRCSAIDGPHRTRRSGQG